MSRLISFNYQSSHGYLYVLVIVDHLSRFVELILLPDKRARTFAEAFIDGYFIIYRIPLEVQTDGVGEFLTGMVITMLNNIMVICG